MFLWWQCLNWSVKIQWAQPRAFNQFSQTRNEVDGLHLPAMAYVSWSCFMDFSVWSWNITFSKNYNQFPGNNLESGNCWLPRDQTTKSNSFLRKKKRRFFVSSISLKKNIWRWKLVKMKLVLTSLGLIQHTLHQRIFT